MADQLLKCDRCGIAYNPRVPALNVKHAACSPESAARDGRAFWSVVRRDLDRRAGR